MLIDAFPFFNELDLLEIRLEVLDPLVDRFVLVEASRDHCNRPKPLFFQSNRERFERFLPKIEHVIVDDLPVGDDNWARERFQRKAISRGLGRCRPSDVILVSDLDEIPKPETVEAHVGQRGLMFFEQTYHCYFINCRAEQSVWRGSAMMAASDFRDAQWVRGYRNKSLNWFRRNVHPKLRHVADGGWHFTFLGGVEAIIKKIESFAHAEFNLPEYKSPERILERMERGDDLFLDTDGDQPRYAFTQVDERYPRYLQDHASRYEHLLHFPKVRPADEEAGEIRHA